MIPAMRFLALLILLVWMAIGIGGLMAFAENILFGAPSWWGFGFGAGGFAAYIGLIWFVENDQ